MGLQRSVATAAVRLGTTAGATDRLHRVYGYGSITNKNNCNIHSQQILPLNVTQNYTCDGLDRLTSFSEGAASQNYDYDAYGNSWVSSYSPNLPPLSLTPQSQSAYNQANNRLVAVGYDTTTGNQTSHSPYTLSYDAEDRLISATSASNGSIAYRYHGEGRRVVKITCSAPTACTEASQNAVKTVFVYDAHGNLAAEYTPGVVPWTGPRFLTVDALGSTRLSTDAAGGDIRRFDYLPFGELLSVNRTARVRVASAQADVHW
jgi:YD repeat-containing protein